MWRHLLAKFASYRVLPVMVSTHESVVPLAMFLWNFSKLSHADPRTLRFWDLTGKSLLSCSPKIWSVAFHQNSQRPTLLGKRYLLLSDPSGTDLTVVFSSSSPSPSSRFKPIVNKQLHSSYFSIATHMKYRFWKLMTRTIQWWPRDDTDKDTHKDKYEDKDKDIQEESLPIYISLRILSSNEYI